MKEEWTVIEEKLGAARMNVEKAKDHLTSAAMHLKKMETKKTLHQLSEASTLIREAENWTGEARVLKRKVHGGK